MFMFLYNEVDPNCVIVFMNSVARYDVPALVNYVLEQNGAKQVAWIGHSEGSTQALANLASSNELHQKISLLVNMAPAAFMSSQG